MNKVTKVGAAMRPGMQRKQQGYYAAGGAAKVRQGVATPAGKPKKA